MRRRFRQLSLTWGLTASLASVFGCTHQEASHEDTVQGNAVRSKPQAVVGGTLSEREPVVLLRSHGPVDSNACTGTLVAPNLVLTARHCVSAFTNGDYSCTIDGFLDLDRPRSPANAGDMGLPYPPEDVHFHVGTVPDYNNPTTVGREIIAPETDTICRNDIAFVILEEELDLKLATIRLEEGLGQGELTTVVGFGLNDNMRVERTERSGLPIDAIGPSDFFPVEGNALPRTFVLGNSVCPGDSGGPAYSDETNEVLGVFSFFRGDCLSPEVRNFFTQAAPFRRVALRAFEAAGYLELIEPDEPDEPDEPSPTEDPPKTGPGGAPGESDDPAAGATPKNKGGCSYHPAERTLLNLSPFALLVVALTYRRRRMRAQAMRN